MRATTNLHTEDNDQIQVVDCDTFKLLRIGFNTNIYLTPEKFEELKKVVNE